MLHFTGNRLAASFFELGLSPPGPDMFRALAKTYGAPGRFYHTQHHIEACLGHLDACRHLAEHPFEIELALWFHDAVYDPRRGDNEARSAAWTRLVLADCGAEMETIKHISALILATDHRSAVATQDAQLLVDIDLAILGQAPALFTAYDAQIRQEYSWVPEVEYLQKRGEVLASFLKREFIYATSCFRSLYEKAARENLQRALCYHGFNAPD